MKTGRINGNVWKRSIERQLHTKRKEVLSGMSAAEACTVLRTGPDEMTVSAGAFASGRTRQTGEYAIVRAVNDLAAKGAQPVAIVLKVLLPEGTSEQKLKDIIGSMEGMCKRLNVQITGAECEVTPAVNQIIVCADAIGKVPEEKILPMGEVRAGQEIILCGSIGLEGMLRILDEREDELSQRFVPVFITQMKELKKELMPINALQTAEKFGITSVCQIDSGGIFAALWNLAEDKEIGLETELGAMTILQETVEVCEYYQLNPYQMTSAGCFLMTTKDGAGLVKALRGSGARASRLGVATDGNARVITSKDEIRYLDRPAPDELLMWQKEQEIRQTHK